MMNICALTKIAKAVRKMKAKRPGHDLITGSLAFSPTTVKVPTIMAGCVFGFFIPPAYHTSGKIT